MQKRVQAFKNIAFITSSELYDLDFTREKLKLFKSKVKINRLVTIQETHIYSIFFKRFYLRWDDDPTKSRFFSIIELIYIPEGTHVRKTINLAALNPSANRNNSLKLELMFDKNRTEALYREFDKYTISAEREIPDPKYLEGALDDSLPARQSNLDANRH